MAPRGLGFLLGVAHRAHRRAWEAELADLGVTAPQAALVRIVAAQPGHGIRQLARALGTDPMNVQRVAASLVDAGLVGTRADPGDSRRRPLHPTDAGAQLADELARRARRAERRLERALGERRYCTMVEGLQTLIDHDRRVLDPAPSADRADTP